MSESKNERRWGVLCKHKDLAKKAAAMSGLCPLCLMEKVRESNEVVNVLADAVARYDGTTVPGAIRKAKAIIKHGDEDVHWVDFKEASGDES